MSDERPMLMQLVLGLRVKARRAFYLLFAIAKALEIGRFVSGRRLEL